jgi:demethylmenaquinone methyltransferase/2-methoxy-6-polyprenyl-1,4-benzoquinol methylase
MANRFFESGDQRAARVRDLFGAIAPRYDLINDLQSFGLHRLWKRRALRLARVQPGEQALDLCCGTGDLALALARAGAPTVGLDFSDAMLARAKARAAARPPSAAPVTFVRGDALQLPFADGRFDVITIAYGLRNLADLDAGLREMLRVARPGGRVVILDFGRPRHPLWRAGYLAYLRVGVPLFGRLFFGDRDTYAYILESLNHYPSAEVLVERLAAAGWAEPRSVPLLGGIMGIQHARRAA